MDSIEKILMERDGFSEVEAKQIKETIMEEVMEEVATGNFQAAEDLFCSNLGLEPDYLLEYIL